MAERESEDLSDHLRQHQQDQITITKSDLNYAYTEPDVYPHWTAAE